MKRLSAFCAWLRGKKTYIVAGAITLATLGGVFAGKLDFAQATALLGFAGGICGLGAKVERHAAQVTAVLADVARAGIAVSSHNFGAAATIAATAVQDSTTLATAIETDNEPAQKPGGV